MDDSCLYSIIIYFSKAIDELRKAMYLQLSQMHVLTDHFLMCESTRLKIKTTNVWETTLDYALEDTLDSRVA